MDDGEVSGGFEWRCENCGERTPKHNPPCNNCGGMHFEKVELDPMAEYEAAESLVPTTRRALVGYGVAGAAAVTGGGYLLYEEYTPPAIPDAPGSAESAGGISFADAESGVVDRVNDERDEPLSPTESARSAARYATAYTVVEGESGSANELFQRLNEFHVGTLRFGRLVFSSASGSEDRAIDGFESATALAESLASNWLNRDDTREFLLNERFSNVGVDVHADPDGDVYASFVVATGGNGLL
jgi:uncharacterized protein YkwD